MMSLLQFFLRVSKDIFTEVKLFSTNANFLFTHDKILLQLWRPTMRTSSTSSQPSKTSIPNLRRGTDLLLERPRD